MMPRLNVRELVVPFECYVQLFLFTTYGLHHEKKHNEKEHS